MRKIAFIFFFFICHSLFAQNNIVAYDSALARDLNKWKSSFTNFSITDFILSDSLAFEKIDSQGLQELPKFYSLYKPLLVFSKNDSSFIDIYSGQINLERTKNGYEAAIDISQPVYLCELQQERWERIAFFEGSGWVDDACWLGAHTFMLVGVQRNEKENNNNPFIYLGDIRKKRFLVYVNKNESCFQKPGGYRSPSLKSLKISGLE